VIIGISSIVLHKEGGLASKDASFLLRISQFISRYELTVSTCILLVEDSPTDAAILVAAFESIGYKGTIEVAKSGIEATDILGTIENTAEQVWPKLILLDLNLPRRSGLEVLDDIKTNPSWMSIPTIVLSSSSSQTDIINSYKRHANAYISKPRQLDHYETVARQLYGFWIETVQSPLH